MAPHPRVADPNLVPWSGGWRGLWRARAQPEELIYINRLSTTGSDGRRADFAACLSRTQRDAMGLGQVVDTYHVAVVGQKALIRSTFVVSVGQSYPEEDFARADCGLKLRRMPWDEPMVERICDARRT